MTTTPPEPRTAPRPRRRRRIPVLLAAVALVLVAVVTARVVLASRDTPSPARPVAQLVRIQASCSDWMVGAPRQERADDSWCSDMVRWMGARPHGSMTGSPGQRDADRMLAACREWVGTARADAVPAGRQRCGDMSAWMEHHMARRGGHWMMDD